MHSFYSPVTFEATLMLEGGGNQMVIRLMIIEWITEAYLRPSQTFMIRQNMPLVVIL